MRVICPHCRTIYELQTSETDVVLVCHRCGTEFGLGEKPEGAQDVDANELRTELTPNMFTDAAEQASVVEPTQRDAAGTETASPSPTQTEDSPVEEDVLEPEAKISASEPSESAGITIPASEEALDREEPDAPVIVAANEKPDDEQAEDVLAGPPPRRKPRIMPWLIVMMLLIVGGGLWLNRDAWLDDPWLRSVLLNAGIELPIRDKDWRIDPNSVSATWLKRQGEGSVLVITGEVHNELQADLPPPLIHVKLFARDNPGELILERDMIITRPPLMQAIRQAPYTPPPQDTTPVGALDKRGFVLVLENLPQNAGNFSLSPKAR